MLPSDRPHWFGGETLMSRRQKPGSKLAQCYSIGVSCISLFIDVLIGGWLCWMSLYLRGWIRALQRVRPAVTRLTGCVCFHMASHDWTVIDGQSITQEAHWKPIIVAPHRTRPLHEQCLSRQSFVLGGLSVCHSVHLPNARQTNLNLNDLSSEDYIRPEFSITQQTAIDIWSENQWLDFH